MFVAEGTFMDGDRFEFAWRTGVVDGSPRMMNLVRLREGEFVRVTPTGPTVVLDLNDAESVAAAVREEASEVRFFGDVPEVPGLPENAQG